MEEKQKSFSAKASSYAPAGAMEDKTEDKEKEKSSSDKAEDKSEDKKEEKKTDLEQCCKKRDEYLAGWQRARADFLNYKKEEVDRVGKLMFFAQANVILGVLPVLDNFRIAEKELPDDSKKDVNIQGLLKAKQELLNFFKIIGVKEIETKNKKFDPNFSEAIEQVEAKDKETGTIVEEVQKGYTLQEQVIRPAKVKTAK